MVIRPQQLGRYLKARLGVRTDCDLLLGIHSTKITVIRSFLQKWLNHRMEFRVDDYVSPPAWMEDYVSLFRTVLWMESSDPLTIQSGDPTEKPSSTGDGVGSFSGVYSTAYRHPNHGPSPYLSFGSSVRGPYRTMDVPREYQDVVLEFRKVKLTFPGGCGARWLSGSWRLPLLGVLV